MTCLISWVNRDLLERPVACCATIDQVDSKLDHLAHEDLALLNTPLLPFTILPFLWELCPVRRAYPNE